MSVWIVCVGCSDLAPRDISGTSDPFTRIIYNNLSAETSVRRRVFIFSHQGLSRYKTDKNIIKAHESGYFTISKSSEIIWWSLYMRNRPQFKSLMNINRLFLHWSSCFCMFKSKTFTIHSITGSLCSVFTFLFLLLILGLQDLGGKKMNFNFFW